MNTLLSLEHATIGYHDRVVLRDVSFDISPGTSLALIGSNGSGKTTFLKSLAGIQPLVRGTLHLGTRSDGGLVRVGYVPQRGMVNALVRLKAREVVEMGTYGLLRPWQGLGPDERERIRQSLIAVELLDRQDKLYSSLSGGQQQRVLIARALATRPDLLLLDEPLASLDQASVQSIREVFLKLQTELNVALIWADHALPTLEGILCEALIIEDQHLRKQAFDASLYSGSPCTLLSGDSFVE
ncbi:MAG: ATP-binding cassette domain-containing protein [Nitrospirales bacterium]|nr:ATP-binding cassette domain-containing protein [Nitrospira sp.]MDR4502570.1 ATP-binding cassette domain-containing protein [Nitrospirales bacterium]